MKRLIRHRVTGEFFQNGNDGKWTKDVQKATSFESMLSILEQVLTHKLTEVEAVLLMSEKPSGYDVVLPINDSQNA